MTRVGLFALTILASLAVTTIAAERKAKLEEVGGETIYFVLGMLDDYSGRSVVEDIPIVERFYCNENVQAFVFRAYLEQLALPGE
jgi:hypothetical protein